MVPPTAPLNLDVEAISGICGSISIACWVVVFSPQILENFKRGSADGLSLHFLIVWLLGDVFNILGAVLQNVLPTMIILAIYYTIADVVLLAQCFYYRGFTWRDDVVPPPKPPKRTTSSHHEHANHAVDERTSLLPDHRPYDHHERRGSDVSHLSPAVPFVSEHPPRTSTPRPPQTRLQAAAFNTLAVLMVCAAGIAGWYLSRGNNQREPHHRHPRVMEMLSRGGNDNSPEDPDVIFNTWGQVFGYLCAALYLGSRVPQLLLNWRRKSTEGISMLFFLFACLGNLTYVLSILAYEPACLVAARRHGKGAADDGCRPGEAAELYWRYVLVNLSWLAGSAGTFFLDLGVFVQFFMYSRDVEEEEDFEAGEGSDDDDERSIASERWDQRPLLERNGSDYSNRRA